MLRARGVRIALGSALALSVLGLGTVAWADMNDSTASPSQTLSTGTLDAPTQPATAPGNCLPAVADEMVLSWTKTASERADGYEILRAVGSGPFTSHALVTGRTSQSFTDSALSFSTQYHYIVKAKKESWRSEGTAPVSRTTRSITCT